MKKLYLAGPEVFEVNPKEKGIELKTVCTAHGFKGLFPLDGQLRVNKIKTPYLKAMEIYRADVELIYEADAVIANMAPFRGPSMDVGTAYEIGFAAALGKPCFGYSADSRSYADKVKAAGVKTYSSPDGSLREFDNKMMVENDGLIDNLMMVGGVLSISRSFEEALAAATLYFKSRGSK